MTDILALDRVSKAFTSRNLRVEAVRRIDLRIQEHEFVTVVGASGCGKPTLLNLIVGLELPGPAAPWAGEP